MRPYSSYANEQRTPHLVDLLMAEINSPEYGGTMNLGGTLMTDGDVERIGKALKTNTTMTKLMLGNSRNGLRGATELGNALSTNKTLVTLDLKGNYMDNAAAIMIAEGLAQNATLKHLDMSSNRMGRSAAQKFGEALKTNKTLRTLLLKNNDFDDEGLAALAEGLEVNTSLSHLAVDTVHVRVKGAARDICATALAKALRANSTLRTLELEHIYLGEDLGEELVSSLATNRGLHTLKLRYTYIGNKGVEALFKALVSNRTLTILDLQTNSCTLAPSADATSFVVPLLATNTTLKSLTLSHNRISQNGFAALATGLRANNGLTHLSVSGTGLNPVDARALAAAVAENTTLQSLDVLNNRLTSDAFKTLVEATLRRKKLMWLLIWKYNDIDKEEALRWLANRIDKDATVRNMCIDVANDTPTAHAAWVELATVIGRRRAEHVVFATTTKKRLPSSFERQKDDQAVSAAFEREVLRRLLEMRPGTESAAQLEKAVGDYLTQVPPPPYISSDEEEEEDDEDGEEEE